MKNIQVITGFVLCVGELEAVKKISKAKSAELDRLQSEYMQYLHPGLRQGILLNHSCTDEMQTLKETVKTKDAELQQLLLKMNKSEHVCDSEWPELTKL